MKNCHRFTALGAALLAGTSLAHAQTVITDQPADMVIAQQPGVVVTQPALAVTAMPVQTVETVRTVRSTTTPRQRVAGRPVRNVTTTRTTVRERVVPAPAIAAAPVTPAMQAITQPGYAEVVQAPGTYPGPLYDVVGPLGPPPPTGVLAQPVAAGAIVTPVPAYRYIYEPDRILVIDANTGIAVEAISR